MNDGLAEAVKAQGTNSPLLVLFVTYGAARPGDLKLAHAQPPYVLPQSAATA